MGVRKVSNSKSDVQDHSSIVNGTVPFDRLHTISYWSSIATMSVCILHR